MFKVSFDFGNKTLCPCCNKAIKPRKWKWEQNLRYEDIYNDDKGEFLELVGICPICHFVFSCNTEVDDTVRAYVFSDKYQNIINAKEMPEYLRKWMAQAYIAELQENYELAFFCWIKCFDYVKLYEHGENFSFLKKAIDIYNAYLDSIDFDATIQRIVAEKSDEKIPFGTLLVVLIAADVCRRGGAFDTAGQLCMLLKNFNFDDDAGKQMVEMIEKLSKLIQDKDATTKFEVVKIG